MSENIELIRELYTRFAERDYENIPELFEEEAEWNQLDGFPNGGIFHGSTGGKNNFFWDDDENWYDWHLEVSDFFETGSTVLAEGCYKGDFISTDRSLKADFLHRFEVRNQKISAFKQYTDTLTIAHSMNLIKSRHELEIHKRRVNEIIFS